MAVAKVGLGKAAFIGDSYPVEDATPKYLREETGPKNKTYDGFKEADDATLLLNIVDWLADEESYTSLVDVDGLLLDQPTALLPIVYPQTSWPSSYGYSGTFSVTADNKGYAYKDITVQIKPNTTGAASLRLRQNGRNLITNNVTIANVAAEPLPETEEPLTEVLGLSKISSACTQAKGKLVTVLAVKKAA